MGFVDTIKHNFTHYVDFKGRAPRSQFWWWMLFVWIGTSVAAGIDAGLGWGVFPGLGVLTTIFSLVVVLPNLGVAVRRLHDGDHTGWWLFWLVAGSVIYSITISVLAAADLSAVILGAVGIVASIALLVVAIIVLVYYIKKGTAGPNRFGADPLA